MAFMAGVAERVTDPDAGQLTALAYSKAVAAVAVAYERRLELWCGRDRGRKLGGCDRPEAAGRAGRDAAAVGELGEEVLGWAPSGAELALLQCANVTIFAVSHAAADHAASAGSSAGGGAARGEAGVGLVERALHGLGGDAIVLVVRPLRVLRLAALGPLGSLLCDDSCLALFPARPPPTRAGRPAEGGARGATPFHPLGWGGQSHAALAVRPARAESGGVRDGAFDRACALALVLAPAARVAPLSAVGRANAAAPPAPSPPPSPPPRARSDSLNLPSPTARIATATTTELDATCGGRPRAASFCGSPSKCSAAGRRSDGTSRSALAAATGASFASRSRSGSCALGVLRPSALAESGPVRASRFPFRLNRLKSDPIVMLPKAAPTAAAHAARDAAPRARAESGAAAQAEPEAWEAHGAVACAELGVLALLLRPPSECGGAPGDGALGGGGGALGGGGGALGPALALAHVGIGRSLLGALHAVGSAVSAPLALTLLHAHPRRAPAAADDAADGRCGAEAESDVALCAARAQLAVRFGGEGAIRVYALTVVSTARADAPRAMLLDSADADEPLGALADADAAFVAAAGRVRAHALATIDLRSLCELSGGVARAQWTLSWSDDGALLRAQGGAEVLLLLAHAHSGGFVTGQLKLAARSSTRGADAEAGSRGQGGDGAQGCGGEAGEATRAVVRHCAGDGGAHVYTAAGRSLCEWALWQPSASASASASWAAAAPAGGGAWAVADAPAAHRFDAGLARARALTAGRCVALLRPADGARGGARGGAREAGWTVTYAPPEYVGARSALPVTLPAARPAAGVARGAACVARGAPAGGPILHVALSGQRLGGGSAAAATAGAASESHLALACARGLAVCARRTGRWRLMTRAADEAKLQVLALGWLGDGALLCACAPVERERERGVRLRVFARDALSLAEAALDVAVACEGGAGAGSSRVWGMHVHALVADGCGADGAARGRATGSVRSQARNGAASSGGGRGLLSGGVLNLMRQASGLGNGSDDGAATPADDERAEPAPPQRFLVALGVGASVHLFSLALFLNEGAARPHRDASGSGGGGAQGAASPLRAEAHVLAVMHARDTHAGAEPELAGARPLQLCCAPLAHAPRPPARGSGAGRGGSSAPPTRVRHLVLGGHAGSDALALRRLEPTAGAATLHDAALAADMSPLEAGTRLAACAPLGDGLWSVLARTAATSSEADDASTSDLPDGVALFLLLGVLSSDGSFCARTVAVGARAAAALLPLPVPGVAAATSGCALGAWARLPVRASHVLGFAPRVTGDGAASAGGSSDGADRDRVTPVTEAVIECHSIAMAEADEHAPGGSDGGTVQWHSLAVHLPDLSAAPPPAERARRSDLGVVVARLRRRNVQARHGADRFELPLALGRADADVLTAARASAPIGAPPDLARSCATHARIRAALDDALRETAGGGGAERDGGGREAERADAAACAWARGRALVARCLRSSAGAAASGEHALIAVLTEAIQEARTRDDDDFDDDDAAGGGGARVGAARDGRWLRTGAGALLPAALALVREAADAAVVDGSASAAAAERGAHGACAALLIKSIRASAPSRWARALGAARASASALGRACARAGLLEAAVNAVQIEEAVAGIDAAVRFARELLGAIGRKRERATAALEWRARVAAAAAGPSGAGESWTQGDSEAEGDAALCASLERFVAMRVG